MKVNKKKGQTACKFGHLYLKASLYKEAQKLLMQHEYFHDKKRVGIQFLEVTAFIESSPSLQNIFNQEVICKLQLCIKVDTFFNYTFM